MNAVQLDDWGRDPALVASGSAVARELLDEAATLRRMLVALEARIAETMGDELPVLGGAEWNRRLALAVAEHFDVSVLELVGRSKVALVIRPRFALCWLIKQVAPAFSAARIGLLVGYEDHTSVLHALHRATEMRAKDENFRWSTDQLLVVARHLRAEALAQRPAPAVEVVS